MSHSKLKAVAIDSVQTLGRTYSQALSFQPILTKSITSGILSALGNYIGQKIKNRKTDDLKTVSIDSRAVISYALFGLLVNGPVSHFWNLWLQEHGPSNSFARLFLDRFVYGPVFLYFTLCLLQIFQGRKLRETRDSVKKMYRNALKGNLKIWLICQYVNLNFVPVQYRTLVASFIAVFWNIYLSFSTDNEKKKD